MLQMVSKNLHIYCKAIGQLGKFPNLFPLGLLVLPYPLGLLDLPRAHLHHEFHHHHHLPESRLRLDLLFLPWGLVLPSLPVIRIDI